MSSSHAITLETYINRWSQPNSGMINRTPLDKGVEGGDTDSPSSITRSSAPETENRYSKLLNVGEIFLSWFKKTKNERNSLPNSAP